MFRWIEELDFFCVGKLSLKLIQIIQRLITSLYHNVHSQESPSPVIYTEGYTKAM